MNVPGGLNRHHPGEEVQVGDYLLKTLQVESHRVQKVQIIPLHKDGELEYEV